MNKIFYLFTNIIICFLILTISITSIFAYQEQDTKTQQEINNVIQKYLKRKEKIRKAPIEIIKIIKGDINNDGTEDQLVNYNLNIGYPGNFSLLYIAVFFNINGALKFNSEIDAGSFGTAIGEQIAIDKIENGVIYCKAYEYAPNDGVCCPSIEKIYKYKLYKGKLKQIKN